MPDALSELAVQFAVLKAAKERKEHEITLINTELGVIGERLFGMFADAKANTLRIAGAGLFTDGRDRIVKPDSSYKGSIANQVLFYEILRADEHGSLIKETVHHETLEKWIAEKKEQNAALPDESILKVWTVEGAKVTRAPKRTK